MSAPVEPAPACSERPLAFIIEDDRAIRQLMEIVLAQLGVETASFERADKALAAFDARRPQIAFLDIALEQSDAVDVINGLGRAGYDGIVQLVSGADPTIMEVVQRIGLRQGLRLPPPLFKPFRGSAIRQIVAPLLVPRTRSSGGAAVA
jgi:DNA-binding NtrC family response regulator